MTMPNRQSCTSTTYTFRHVAVAALVTTYRSHTYETMKCRLLLGILLNITPNHSRWDTNTNADERGVQIAVEVDTSDYTILSENDATWLPTNGRSSSPVMSLASNDIALLSIWSVFTSLASNYLPILITINSELSTINGPRRTYINLTKADLVRYAEARTNTLLKLANRPRRPSEKQ